MSDTICFGVSEMRWRASRTVGARTRGWARRGWWRGICSARPQVWPATTPERYPRIRTGCQFGRSSDVTQHQFTLAGDEQLPPSIPGCRPRCHHQVKRMETPECDPRRPRQEGKIHVFDSASQCRTWRIGQRIQKQGFYVDSSRPGDTNGGNILVIQSEAATFRSTEDTELAATMRVAAVPQPTSWADSGLPSRPRPANTPSCPSGTRAHR